MKKNLIPFVLASLCSLNVFSQVITLSQLATGLSTPIGIMNTGVAGDDRLFVTERLGKIKIFNRLTGAVNATPFLDITSRVLSSTNTGEERGLLGLAFHPDYATNGYFYVDYINLQGRTIIARYQVSSFPDTALVNSEQIMMNIYQPQANHNGGNLMFGWDGYLYISMGDGGNFNDQGTGHNVAYGNAQHVDSLLGKILRIDVSNPNAPYYYSPSTNPFYGGGAPAAIPYAGTLPARDEIFDWGLRNPWRCSIDRMTGDKWIADVGQGSIEEIDFESRCDSSGRNYGWRCYEGNNNFNTLNCQPITSYTAPIYTYTHSNGNCSVTGGYVYRGGQEGGMFGKYFFGDYCSGRMWATVPNGTGGWVTNILTQTNSLITTNLTSFGEDIYGELYISAHQQGIIYKVIDTACAPTAYINAPDTIINCTGTPITFNAIYGTGLLYQWYIGATPVGTSSSSYTYTPFANGEQLNVVVTGNCIATSNVITIYTDVSFSGLDTFYCDTTSPVALTGVPSGGTFSGPGINGNMFSPALAGIGTHQVIYTYADTVSNCYYTASGCILIDTQTVVVDICTGIEEQNDVRNLSVYPNPSHSEFNIEFSLARDNDVSLIITDALGRMVKQQNIKAARGKQNIQVALDVTDGVYFLYLKTKNSMAVSKIIVSR
ncbi:MAG TPA: PQQ-dependent sugar dehydrogenase [Bacteroidia bacterium]|nr:PQQ-dependent sugar dehydrogenase [Bacteroidia bacterium]